MQWYDLNVNTESKSSKTAWKYKVQSKVEDFYQTELFYFERKVSNLSCKKVILMKNDNFCKL